MSTKQRLVVAAIFAVPVLLFFAPLNVSNASATTVANPPKSVPDIRTPIQLAAFRIQSVKAPAIKAPTPPPAPPPPPPPPPPPAAPAVDPNVHSGVTPLPGEGVIAITTRICGNANGWQQVAADNGIPAPDYPVALGQVLTVKCGQSDPAPVVAAAISQPPAPAPAGNSCSGWTPNYWDGAQRSNAAVIIQVGKNLGMGRAGEIIALMTAMQESSLNNLNYGDRDSLGLFQQRPSMGWGSPAQIMDPWYSSAKFYNTLAGVGGWWNMEPTLAAQAVQRSAYPYAYAHWQQDATGLVNEITCS